MNITSTSKHRSAGTEMDDMSTSMTAITTSMPFPFFVLIRRSVDELENVSQKIESVFCVKDICNSPWQSFECFQNELIKRFNVQEHDKISYINMEGKELLINSQCRLNQVLELAQAYLKEGKAVPLLIDPIERNKNISYNHHTEQTESSHTSTDDNNRNHPNDNDSNGENDSAFKSLPVENESKPNIMELASVSTDLASGSTQVKSHENSKEESQKTCDEKLREQECMCSSAAQLDTCNGNVEKTNSNRSERNEEQLKMLSANSSPSVDESPPAWFVKYQNTVKNEIVEEVSTKMTSRIAKMLKKTTLDARKIMEERKNAEIESKYYLRQVKAAEERLRKLQNKLEYTLECLKEKKLRKQIVDILNDLQNTDNEQEDSQTSKSEMEIISKSPKNSAKHTQMERFLCDESTTSGTSKPAENEIRMNCSITGHQMLSESQDKDGFYNVSNQDSISTSSDVSNLTDSQEEDDNFEMIRMPPNSNEDFQRQDVKPYEKLKNLAVVELDSEICQNENNDSNRDSPSFELLSQTPSTPLSMCIDEDHFSTNENSITTLSSLKTDLNDLDTDVRYVVDENDKLYNDAQQETAASIEDDKSTKVCTFVANDFSTPGDKQTCYALLKSAQIENTELNFDVKTSHSSYPNRKPESSTVESKEPEVMPNQRSCQSQTGSGEFAQSFHSHTTSISTDNELYPHKISAGPSFKAATDVGHSKRTLNRTDVDKKVSEKKVRKAPRKWKMENFNSSDPLKARGIGEQRKSNAEHIDPVYILPEILTNGASSIASIAFSSARGFLSKLRAEAREDSAKQKNSD